MRKSYQHLSIDYLERNVSVIKGYLFIRGIINLTDYEIWNCILCGKKFNELYEQLSDFRNHLDKSHGLRFSYLSRKYREFFIFTGYYKKNFKYSGW